MFVCMMYRCTCYISIYTQDTVYFVRMCSFLEVEIPLGASVDITDPRTAQDIQNWRFSNIFGVNLKPFLFRLSFHPQDSWYQISFQTNWSYNMLQSYKILQYISVCRSMCQLHQWASKSAVPALTQEWKGSKFKCISVAEAGFVHTTMPCHLKHHDVSCISCTHCLVGNTSSQAFALVDLHQAFGRCGRKLGRMWEKHKPRCVHISSFLL